MAEIGLFYNALPDPTYETGYDRNYNADDLSNWLRFVFTNGVVKTHFVDGKPTGLKVVEAGGMTVNLSIGYACINGKPYVNTGIRTFNIPTAPTGNTPRYDYIVIRFNNQEAIRATKAYYVTGNSTIPNATKLTQNDDVFEIMLCYIKVNPSVLSITQADIVDTRDNKDLCGFVTAVKGYEEYYDAIVQRHKEEVLVKSATKNIFTNLSSKLYNKFYSLISVYLNGLLVNEEDYTINVSGAYIGINFNHEVISGNKVTVVLECFLDGEGMESVANQYSSLIEQVKKLEGLNEFNYYCNGKTDNVLISNIIREFYSVNDYRSMKLNVIGEIGMTAPFGGEGTKASPYVWFNFNNPVDTNRIVTIDFTQASAISPTINDGTDNIIFRTNKIIIVGATVIASNTSTNTLIIVNPATSGAIKYENCRFYITAYYDSVIAYRGTFTNCRGSVANVTNASYCFLPNTNGVVKIVGGEYYAYTGDSLKASAIVGQSGEDAVSILYNVSAPTLARSGFYQTHAILQYGGVVNCNDMITELTINVMSGASSVRGTIAKSKTNVW